MQQPHQSVKLSPVYGIVIAFISVVFAIIFYATKQYGNLWTGYFGNLVMFLGVLISIVHYNRAHHDRASAMSSFAMGLRTTLLATLLVVIFTIIFHLVSDAGSGHEMVTEGTNTVADNEGVKRNFWITLLGNILFINIIVGVLASVVGAMVFKANQKTTTSKGA